MADNYKNGYQQSGYTQNGYQQSGYTQNGYQQSDPYMRASLQKSYGNHDRQSQIRQRKGHTDFAISAGIMGAMALGPTTGVIGSAVASGAGAAGLTSIAALGSLPVAGPLLLGGGAIIGGAVAAVIAGHTLYKGVKALSSLKSNASEAYNRPTTQERQSYLPPQVRTRDEGKGKFLEMKEKGNQVNNDLKNIKKEIKENRADSYLKDVQKDFEGGKEIGTKIKNIANLKGLSSKQKKEISNLYGDNLIHNSARENGGVVNNYNIKKQVIADAKEQGWNKSKTAQMISGVNKRLEAQKDMQNITKDNKVMSMQKESLHSNKSKAVKNVDKQTEKMGNFVKACMNSNVKPTERTQEALQARIQQAQKPQKIKGQAKIQEVQKHKVQESQTQKSQQSANFSKEIERDR